MESHLEQLKAYIRQQLQFGLTSDEVSAQLQHAGWQREHIYQAFAALQQEMMPAQLAQHHQHDPHAAHQTQSAPAQQPSLPQANGRRRGRIRTGWLLLKQSFRVLKGNSYLLRYLLMTGAWAFALTAVFAAVYVAYYNFVLDNGITPETDILWYVLAFLCYLTFFFFVNLYAAGLAANILDIFQGRRQPYHAYMSIAWSRAGAIFVFSLISATIGMFLQFIVERIRFVGWLLAWIFGTLWSLGTMFVLPIMVTSDKPSAVRSIGQSIRFFKGTWGENVVSKASVNIPLAIINFVVVLALIVLAVPVISSAGFAGLILMVVLYLVVMTTIWVIGSFANSVINVALYYYAVHQKVPPAFDAELLNNVFRKRKRRFFKKVD